MPLTGHRSHKSPWLTGFLIILMTAGAAGCAPAVSEASPTSENLLESLVAEAVETQRVEGQQASQNFNATLTGAAEQPAVLAAQTLTPTITPTPEASDTPQLEIPTMPSQPTYTLTPPSAPPRNAQDPALRLGEPAWTDSFNSSENWTEFTGRNSQIEVRDGQLFYTIFEANATPTWTISWPQISNFYLEVLARTPQTCSGKDRLGLIFRAPDPDHGYRLEISCDGQYRVVVFSEDSAEVVIAWASSDNLLSGPNQVNRIGVWANGKIISIYINGVPAAGVEHNDYRTGTFGFTVTSEQTDNFSAAFDDLTFWSFP